MDYSQLPLSKPKRKKKRRYRWSEAMVEVHSHTSDLSGRYIQGRVAPHHIISVGAGGPEHRYNLIQLTAEEHIRVHAGSILSSSLWAVVERRDGIENAEQKVREIIRT